MKEQTTSELGELTAAEKSIILRIRELRPYERIEIKLNDNRYGEISIVSTLTNKEIFPLDMV